MGWDDSPGYNYQDITGLSPSIRPEQRFRARIRKPRIHFLQFKYPIDLTGVSQPDTDGDTGVPLLTFWQAYDIKPNASIRVEYFDTGTSTWTDDSKPGDADRLHRADRSRAVPI